LNPDEHKREIKQSPARSKSPSDTGTDTRIRFTYQDTYAAMLAIRLLNPDEYGFDAIYCEDIEDIRLYCTDGKSIAVQVKSRETGQDPFSATEEVILKSIRNFVRCEIDNPGMFKNFIIASNYGFKNEGKPDYCLEKILDIASGQNEIEEIEHKILKSYIKKINDKNEFKEQTILDVLKKTVLESELIDIGKLEIILRDEIATKLGLTGSSYDDLIQAAKDLTILMREAAEHDEKPKARDCTKTLDQIKETREEIQRSGKCITREMVEKTLSRILSREKESVGFVKQKLPGILFGKFDPLPSNYQDRQDYTGKVKNILLSDDQNPVGITGLRGMGGIGKSVLAGVIARDPDIQKRFESGIFWIKIGKDPDLLTLLKDVAKVFGFNKPFESVNEGQTVLRYFFKDESCLLILDDIWNVDDVSSFNVLSPESKFLITTRDSGIITALGAKDININLLEKNDARELLAKWMNCKTVDLPPGSDEIIKQCGYLPLAISVCGARLRDGTLYDDLISKLKAADVKYLHHPHGDVLKSIEVSVKSLPAEKINLYLDLSVFPEDIPIPEDAIITLWGYETGFDNIDTRDLITEFQNKSLLSVKEENSKRFISMHDLHHDYVTMECKDKQSVHRKLIEAYREKCLSNAFHNGPNDGYYFQNLAYHLIQSGKKDELTKLLFDINWMQARLDNTDANGLISDYEFIKDDPDLETIKKTIRMSTHVLFDDPSQLASQLTGRLLSEKPNVIKAFVDNINKYKTNSWLKPLLGSLTPPGTWELILKGHTGNVMSVAVISKNIIVSASEDKTLKIWDIKEGKQLKTLKGHTGVVLDVAIHPDGYVISVSDDETIKIWDWENNKIVRTLKGHDGAVRSVAILPDKRIITSSNDRTLKIWDIDKGRIIKTLWGHDGMIRDVVAISNNIVASASNDKTVKVWDIVNGKILHDLKGHKDWVRDLSVISEDQVISASDDKTLKIWSIKYGIELKTLIGHTSGVRSVATLSSNRVISASTDRNLKVWDISSGNEIKTLSGHTGVVRSVEVLFNSLVVSSSWDRTIRIWDVDRIDECKKITNHESYIYDVVPINAKRIVTASNDRTLKIWDISTGKEIRTLSGHQQGVLGVACLSENRIISSSMDQTLKIWDLDKGCEIKTLKWHHAGIWAVAILPYDRVISASSDQTLKIWSLNDGNAIKTLRGHLGKVRDVALVSDDRVISASYDGTLKLWDIKKGKEIKTLKGHNDVVLALIVLPNGHVVSSSCDQTLKIWDIENGHVIETLKGHTGSVNSLAFHTDGQIISASSDQTLRVWDIEKRISIATFTVDSPLFCCTVASNKTIIAGDASGTLHFLKLVETDSN
jgi:WD40 repeat protein